MIAGRESAGRESAGPAPALPAPPADVGSAPAADAARASTADAILRAIACAAEQEATQLLRDADDEATAVVEAAHELVGERVATACEAAEAAARQEAARTINATRLRLVHRRAELASGALDGVFAAAGARLELLSSGSEPARWAAALERLARDALALTGPRSEIEVRAADAPLLEPLARELGVHLRALEGPGVPAGIVARSADRRVEVDATLPTRLARARASLSGRLAEALGLEE